MNKRVLGIILQVPMIFTVIASFFAGIYAAMNNIGGITIAAPIILFVFIVLYFYGRYLEKKGNRTIKNIF